MGIHVRHAIRLIPRGFAPCYSLSAESQLWPSAIVFATSSTLSQFRQFSSIDGFAGKQLLDNLVDWEQKGVPQAAGTSASDDFDLARVRRLLACLGEPHLSWPSIHVAGSKGGSLDQWL